MKTSENAQRYRPSVRGQKCKKLLFSLCLVFSLCLSLFSLAGCAARTKRRDAYLFDTFDTVVTYTDFSAASDEEFSARFAIVEERFRHYHALFDIYHTYEGVVNIATINAAAGGEPVAVSDELFAFLLFCLDVGEKTGWKTDVTLGAVTSLWHDARLAATEGVGVAPTAEAIADAMTHTGRDTLELDVENKTVRLTDPRASLDVGAIAKGYAVEMTARVLADAGISGVLINGGGNVRTLGEKPGGAPFVVALRDPLGDGNLEKTVTLRDGAVAQSGSYERAFVADGITYSHIVDSRTGYPPTGLAAVSVVSSDAALSDALSTALFCLSVEEGRRVLAAFPGVYAVWVLPDGRILS